MRKVLFIPGPTEVDPDVLVELSKPVMPHYGLDWGELYNSACEASKKIFKTKEFVALLPIPGSVAIEMSILNILEKVGEEVVNITNGYFGDYQGEMLRWYGAKVLEIRNDVGQGTDIEALKETLDLNPRVKAIYSVHNETSTGVADNIIEIAKIARKYDKLFIVDTISSYGGMELEFDAWGIDYAVGYASKCLSSINGICPIAVSKRFLERVKKRKTPVKSYYFDLQNYIREVNKWSAIGHPHPTSVPTSVIRAFHIAQTKALEEGLEERYLRHRRVGEAYRAAFRAMRLDILAKEKWASPVVTAVKTPEGIEDKIRALLLERFGFMIGSGLGLTEGKVVRVGHMGITASPQYMIQLVPAFEVVLKDLGVVDKVGPGIEAAMKILSKR
ncbi:MAG: alanine--glyoxylate aminotransferase family protein [Nitrososphaeria archaeon]